MAALTPFVPIAIEVVKGIFGRDKSKAQLQAAQRELAAAQRVLNDLQSQFGELQAQSAEQQRQFEEERRRHEEQMSVVNKRLEAAATEAQRLGDPKKFREVEKELFDGFLAHLKTLQFADTIPRSIQGEKHCGFIGPISSGKTTIINVLFGLSLPTGVGDVTSEASMVHASREKKIAIWDCPGVNEDWAYFNSTMLSFFKSLDHVFVCFHTSPRSCDKIVRMIDSLRGGQGISVLRTQCDLARSTDNRTIDDEVRRDVETLRGWEIQLPVAPVADPSAGSRYNFNYVKGVMGLP